MKMPISKNWQALLIFLVFSAFIVFQVNVGFDLVDTFHEGEYVGLVWHMLAYYAGNVPFPLVIHGSLDFIPSLIAKKIFGDSHIIVGTRIINSLITIITWTFFLDFCWRLIKKSRKNIFWILVPLFFIFLASKYSTTALELHQAFIGPRDLFLVISLWAFIFYEQCDNRKIQGSCIFILCFSALFGLYWSYDRGVMAALVVFAFVASLLYRKRKADSILCLAMIIIVLLFLEYTKIVGTVADLISNIIFWIKNGKEIWNSPAIYPISLQPLMLPLTLFTLIPLIAVGAINDFTVAKKSEVIVIVLLILIEILMIKTIFNRPGLPRTSWGLWPLISLFVYGVSRLPTSGLKAINFSNEQIWPIRNLHLIFLFVPALTLSIAFSNFFYSYPNLSAFSAFKAHAISPKSDVEIVSKEVKNVASKLGELKAGCVLSWTNEGVIGLLARLPLCTKFHYAVYSSLASQTIMIEQLSVANPKAIVFESPSLAMKIDGRPMENRLPAVFSYITKNYPVQIQVGQYVIRTKNVKVPLN